MLGSLFKFHPPSYGHIGGGEPGTDIHFEGFHLGPPLFETIFRKAPTFFPVLSGDPGVSQTSPGLELSRTPPVTCMFFFSPPDPPNPGALNFTIFGIVRRFFSPPEGNLPFVAGWHACHGWLGAVITFFCRGPVTFFGARHPKPLLQVPLESRTAVRLYTPPLSCLVWSGKKGSDTAPTLPCTLPTGPSPEERPLQTVSPPLAFNRFFPLK